MRLKVFTTALLIFGVLLMGGFFVMAAKSPLVRAKQETTVSGQVGAPTEETPESKAAMREKKLFAARMGIYVMVLFTVWIGVIICSMILIRRARMELAEEAAANMKAFVEGTLHDHAKRTAEKKPALDEEPSDG